MFLTSHHHRRLHSGVDSHIHVAAVVLQYTHAHEEILIRTHSLLLAIKEK